MTADLPEADARSAFMSRFQHYDGYRSEARQADLLRVFQSGAEWAAEHLATVQPDRDTIARVWDDGASYGIAYQAGNYDALEPETRTARIDAVLALWPGRTVAEVKAEALREAADDPSLRLAGHSGISITRLRARAARLRAGETR